MGKNKLTLTFQGILNRHLKFYNKVITILADIMP